jgi:hypothetical protein
MGAPAEEADAQPKEWGYDLLLSGQEEVLKGSDTGVLVAFAALAFQQIRGGEPRPHYNVGYGFLLVSVLLCAAIHFFLGTALVGRARKLLRGGGTKTRRLSVSALYTTVAWAAGLLQLFCIVVGLVLILREDPPSILERYLLPYFR